MTVARSILSFCKPTGKTLTFSDQCVEAGFYKRAVGYGYEGEKLFAYEGTVIRAAAEPKADGLLAGF